jgi:hypothetical protein
MGDPKATMQYDRYEKLIVVDKGVELINWPDEVPFINASDIGSMHTLRKLHDALTMSNIDKQCHWVMLSEDEWANTQMHSMKLQLMFHQINANRRCRSLSVSAVGTYCYILLYMYVALPWGMLRPRSITKADVSSEIMG